HQAHKASASAAAVAGGLTSFMDMPNTSPPTLDATALEDKYARAAGRARANYGFYFGASNDNLEAVRGIDPRATPGLKVFMGASTGNMLVDAPDTGSPDACRRPTRLALRPAGLHGPRVHVLHVPPADERALFERGPLVRADGSRKRVTAETCIHFLRFERADYERLGHQIKCNP